MKIPWKAASLSVALAMTPAAAAATEEIGSEDSAFPQSIQELNDRTASLKRMQAEIARWPRNSQDLADIITSEYGAPQEIAPSELTWNDRKPWTRIVVRRDPAPPGRPDGLRESVAYEVPLRRWRALSAFDRGVEYDPVKNELIARSDREPTNILALNLADEVVRGVRSPEQASAFFDATLALSLSGKSSPYMRRLLFEPGAPATAPHERVSAEDEP